MAAFDDTELSGSVLAIRELLVAPHRWNKTPHRAGRDPGRRIEAPARAAAPRRTRAA